MIDMTSVGGDLTHALERRSLLSRLPVTVLACWILLSDGAIKT